jgi:cytochrome c peroxidase
MQALAPISHPKEMAENMEHVVLKLSRSKLYRKLFFSAYNDSIVTGEKVLKALSQFQLTLVSAESKYDSVMVRKAHFNEQEKNGYALFKQHCNACHTEPLFTSLNFENNGLSVDPKLNDHGRWNITGLASDSLLFKVPSLRNLEYTYPYMHDGRFKKLSQVVQHYSSGISHSRTLSKALEKPMNISTSDEVDLVAFLLTLSDRKFLFDPSHSFPKEVFFPSAKGSQ